MDDRVYRDRLAFIRGIDNTVRDKLYGYLPNDDEYHDLRDELVQHAFEYGYDLKDRKLVVILNRLEKYVARKRAEQTAPKKTPRPKRKPPKIKLIDL